MLGHWLMVIPTPRQRAPSPGWSLVKLYPPMQRPGTIRGILWIRTGTNKQHMRQSDSQEEFNYMQPDSGAWPSLVYSHNLICTIKRYSLCKSMTQGHTVMNR